MNAPIQWYLFLFRTCCDVSLGAEKKPLVDKGERDSLIEWSQTGNPWVKSRIQSTKRFYLDHMVLLFF